MVWAVPTPAAAAIRIKSKGASVMTWSRQQRPQHPHRYENELARRTRLDR